MKPFDLEAAKSGAPIITRDGREARFIAHVPEVTDESCSLLALVDGVIYHYWPSGEMTKAHESRVDLFMKPQKRTVWVNMYVDRFKQRWCSYDTKEEARKYAGQTLGIRYIAVAVPIEIEE